MNYDNSNIIICLIASLFIGGVSAFLTAIEARHVLSNCIKSQEWCEIESPMFNRIIYGDENDHKN